MPPRSGRQERLVDRFGVEDAPHRITVALREVHRGAASTPDASLLPPGLEPGQQLDAIGLLVIKHASGCRMSELARDLRIDASTATRAVDRLVAQGLATRRPSDEDGRALIVEPTDFGIECYLSAAEATSPVFRALLNSAFSPDEQETLASLLERLIEAFDDEMLTAKLLATVTNPARAEGCRDRGRRRAR